MIDQFQCVVYLADGFHVSQVEPCECVGEAVARAKAWQALGHKAEAQWVTINTQTLEVAIHLLG